MQKEVESAVKNLTDRFLKERISHTSYPLYGNNADCCVIKLIPKEKYDRLGIYVSDQPFYSKPKYNDFVACEPEEFARQFTTEYVLKCRATKNNVYVFYKQLEDNSFVDRIVRTIQEVKLAREKVNETPAMQKYMEIMRDVDSGKMKVREDNRGYFILENGTYLHRLIARECIYNLNREKYPLDFRDYEVHHIFLRDNDYRGLDLVLKGEHKEIHQNYGILSIDQKKLNNY